MEKLDLQTALLEFYINAGNETMADHWANIITKQNPDLA